jgi:hypothetical protein
VADGRTVLASRIHSQDVKTNYDQERLPKRLGQLTILIKRWASLAGEYKLDKLRPAILTRSAEKALCKNGEGSVLDCWRNCWARNSDPNNKFGESRKMAEVGI